MAFYPKITIYSAMSTATESKKGKDIAQWLTENNIPFSQIEAVSINENVMLPVRHIGDLPILVCESSIMTNFDDKHKALFIEHYKQRKKLYDYGNYGPALTKIKPGIKTWLDFPDFYLNSDIEFLSRIPRWTVSGKLQHSDKVPMDLKALQRGYIAGAKQPTQDHLGTLAEVVSTFPQASNHAFYSSAASDGLVILDIEKTCPPEISQKLIETLPWTYAEKSMSGLGYHLVLPLPENFYEFSHLINKPVLKEEHGWYEILMNHYSTFTRNTLPLPIPKFSEETNNDWNELFKSLGEKAQPVAPINSIDISERPNKIKGQSVIINDAIDEYYRRNDNGEFKSLEDFNNDTSRWEYSTMAHCYLIICEKEWQSKKDIDNPNLYSSEELTWLTYDMATTILPERDKHLTLRNGVPYLLAQASQIVSSYTR